MYLVYILFSSFYKNKVEFFKLIKNDKLSSNKGFRKTYINYWCIFT